MGCNCDCPPQLRLVGENEAGPVTAEEAFDLAFDLLLASQEEARAGRPTEATVLNQSAQVALQLAQTLRAPHLASAFAGNVH